MELVGWLAWLLTGMMGWAVDGAESEDSFSFEFFLAGLGVCCDSFCP